MESVVRFECEAGNAGAEAANKPVFRLNIHKLLFNFFDMDQKLLSREFCVTFSVRKCLGQKTLYFHNFGRNRCYI